MATDLTTNGQDAPRGKPAWDVALLFPVQGEWTEEEYLALDQGGENRLIELVDGCLEVLPMPDLFHQGIVRYIFRHLDRHATEQNLGEVFTAPSPVRLGPGHLREPDIFLVRAHRIKSRHEPPAGADLAVEVLSRGRKNRQGDLITKRAAYAKAKISEYWIVDPQEQRITVLTLSGKTYKVHGVFAAGDQATSKLVPGFILDVAAVFAAGRGE